MHAIDIEGASRKSTVLVGERLQLLERYLPAGWPMKRVAGSWNSNDGQGRRRQRARARCG